MACRISRTISGSIIGMLGTTVVLEPRAELIHAENHIMRRVPTPEKLEEFQ
jgi:hypothetical protein